MGFIGVIAFVVALLFSVMVHEYGHYATARRYGMRVTEFFLGFGKRIWSTQRGETEFGLKAIPAGGYCKISGMSIHEEMEEDQKHRAFYLASTPKKLVVLGAGSFLHFILGFVLLFTLFAGVAHHRYYLKFCRLLIVCQHSQSANLEIQSHRPNNLAFNLVMRLSALMAKRCRGLI